MLRRMMRGVLWGFDAAGLCSERLHPTEAVEVMQGMVQGVMWSFQRCLQNGGRGKRPNGEVRRGKEIRQGKGRRNRLGDG